jgi:DNA-binding NtrC family response regulator
MPSKPCLLVVDDDSVIRSVLSSSLKTKFEIIEASDYKSAVDKFNLNSIDVVLLDIEYEINSKNGLDVLKYIRAMFKHLPVLILSSVTDLSKIIEAMKLGASDYILKNEQELYRTLPIKIEKLLEQNLLKRSIDCLKTNLNHELVYKSFFIKNIIEEIESVPDMNILIEGETGVGKTPIAYFANSVATENSNIRPFVRINCGGFTKERMQDELFGHKRGAYTGASSDKPGLVELANGGDIFFDEIGELNKDCQAELLVFLDTGEYRRLGENNIRYSKCRIISATNRSLDEDVKSGNFRKDLYSRLSQCRFFIPPLRDRREDIVPVTKFYINKFCGYQKECSQELWSFLNAQSWSEGNVRELRDTVRYMCLKSKESDQIEMSHINPKRWNISRSSVNLNQIDKSDKDNFLDNYKVKDKVFSLGYEEYVKHLEKIVLQKLALEENSMRSLAKKVRLSTTKLYRKLKTHDVKMNSAKRKQKKKQLGLFS